MKKISIIAGALALSGALVAFYSNQPWIVSFPLALVAVVLLVVGVVASEN